MPLKVSEIIEQATNLQSVVWNSAAKAGSEVLGVPLQAQSTQVSALESNDLVDLGATGVLCISFSLAHQPDHIQTLIIDELQLAGFLSGLQGQLISIITQSILDETRELFESMVQGMCQGIGRSRGEATAPSQLTIKLTPFVAQDNLLRAKVILKSTVELVCDAAQLEMFWVFDESSLSGMTQGDKEEEKPFTGRAHSSEVGVSGTPPEDASLQMLFDIPLEISVELGRVKMVVKDVLELGAGSIVEIEKAAGEPVDVLVNGKYVARGEVVVIEDNFGVRITEILSPSERLARLSEAA